MSGPSAGLETRLLNALQQSVVATDVEGKVIYWNAHAERLYGWSAAEAIGRPIIDLSPSETTRAEAIAIMEQLSQGHSWSGEFPVRRKDGTSVQAFIVNSPLLDEHGALVGIVGVSTDVSEQRALEAQLRQATKLEALGRLAGGVAHDFNNLLTVILGNITFLKEGQTSPDAIECLQEMKEAGERAAALTRQLLTFSRRHHLRPEPLELGAALKAMKPMLSRLISEDIAVSIDVTAPELVVVVDSSQFDQVVLNLALNARDAMPTGGTLRLELAPHPDMPTQKVLLTVSDTGTGIPAHVLPHIFEPFFTTKEKGHGTGLGLATVYGVVTQAGGSVEVKSTGAGTRFELCWPRVATQARTVSVATTAPMPTAQGTILVVEDDSAVRALVSRVLSTAGYSVMTAETGDDAVVAMSGRAASIDLLLTDIVMPGMNGVSLTETLRRRQPALPVLFLTGYSEEEVLRRGAALPGAALLQKPFVPTDLLGRVRDAMIKTV